MSLSQQDFNLIQELLKTLQGIREELIRIEEAIRDTALPKATQINVKRGK